MLECRRRCGIFFLLRLFAEPYAKYALFHYYLFRGCQSYNAYDFSEEPDCKNDIDLTLQNRKPNLEHPILTHSTLALCVSSNPDKNVIVGQGLDTRRAF